MMKDLSFTWESRVAVDSGQLSIADPAYWDDERLAYDNILKLIEQKHESPVLELGDLGHSAMAAVFPTINGDGIYDVYSVWSGESVVGMFVSFVTDDFMGHDYEGKVDETYKGLAHE